MKKNGGKKHYFAPKQLFFGKKVYLCSEMTVSETAISEVRHQ
jgi:hypothetical protein